MSSCTASVTPLSSARGVAGSCFRESSAVWALDGGVTIAPSPRSVVSGGEMRPCSRSVRLSRPSSASRSPPHCCSPAVTCCLALCTLTSTESRARFAGRFCTAPVCTPPPTRTAGGRGTDGSPPAGTPTTDVLETESQAVFCSYHLLRATASETQTSCHRRPQRTENQDRAQRTTTDHKGLQQITEDHNRAQRTTTEHRGPQQSTEDHNRAQRTTAEYRGPRQSTEDYSRPQRTTTEHRGPRQSTEDLDRAQRTRTEHR